MSPARARGPRMHDTDQARRVRTQLGVVKLGGRFPGEEFGSWPSRGHLIDAGHGSSGEEGSSWGWPQRARLSPIATLYPAAGSCRLGTLRDHSEHGQDRARRSLLLRLVSRLPEELRGQRLRARRRATNLSAALSGRKGQGWPRLPPRKTAKTQGSSKAQSTCSHASTIHCPGTAATSFPLGTAAWVPLLRGQQRGWGPCPTPRGFTCPSLWQHKGSSLLAVGIRS